MQEDEIEVFVERVLQYFHVYDTESPAEVLTPYLIDGVDDYVLEYTGLIGIAGRNEGAIMFTAPPSLLLMLMARYGETSAGTPDIMLDLVGEIANTIAGNVREVFGSKFELSPPVAVRAPVKGLVVAKGLQSYCIPIKWRLRTAFLIISLS